VKIPKQIQCTIKKHTLKYTLVEVFDFSTLAVSGFLRQKNSFYKKTRIFNLIWSSKAIVNQAKYSIIWMY